MGCLHNKTRAALYLGKIKRSQPRFAWQLLQVGMRSLVGAAERSEAAILIDKHTPFPSNRGPVGAAEGCDLVP